MRQPYRVIEDGLREELCREVGRSRFRLWFRDTEVRRVEEDAVTLGVPTEVHRTWLQYTYGSLLQRAVDSVLGVGLEVRLEVSRRQGAKREVRERLPATPQEWEELLEQRRPRPRLESFVCEGSDRFPSLLLSQFVHGNGDMNPPAVYLYGDQGTGKTHLLSALHAAVDSYDPGASLYLTSRRFTSMFVSAVRAQELEAVRAFEVDLCHRRLVLIDDLHSLSGRTATQHALVRLRERTVGTPTRFVFSAQQHPQEVESISGKFRSWLMSSVILRMRTPDRAALIRVLDARARDYGLAGLPGEVCGWILEHTGSVHGAVGVLDRWAAASAELSTLLGAEWLDELAPSVAGSAREEIIRRAKRVVTDHFGVAAQVFENPTKVRSAALPRRIAMYLVYRATALPLVEIGRAFGLSSHSSVSRAIGQIRARRDEDPELEHVVDGLLARM